MKRFKFVTIMMILATFLFGGMLNVKADTITPNTFVTHKDDRIILDYIKYKTVTDKDDDYRLFVKKAADGTYLYCIDLKKHYDGNMTYTKSKVMDEGIEYILNHKPNTGDKNKDYYITQMAIYFYQDWLNNNNANLQEPFKKLIVTGAKVEDTNLDATTKEVCKAIYNTWLAAKDYANRYVAKDGYINITTNYVKFTEVDGYFVSSKIYLKYGNLDGDLKKTMVDAPEHLKVYRDTEDGGYVLKIPVSDIGEGKKVTFKLRWEGTWTDESAWYYVSDSDHQRLLYDKIQKETKNVKAEIQLTVKNFIEKYQVKISKTDVTQTKEIPGAHLVVKDANGNVVEEWTSTNETKKLILEDGEYSLTETIAPDGYKLSTTTIYFMLDANGKLYTKVNGTYVQVDKINMINELKDVISFAKKDATNDSYIAGAILVVKDASGNVVAEFTSNDSVYQLVLDAGDYTLEEKAAPSGYILSNEVVSFRVLSNGALQVKNSNGVYEDSVMVVFYNTPSKKEVVPVPATGASGLISTIAGLSLLIAGVVYVRKTTKEC